MTGLYVHIPYCDTKCGYCDFYSVPLESRDTSPVVQAILDELHQRQNTIRAPFQTIFAGGGTPTVLPVLEMRQLFSRLGAVAQRDRVREFTTEANPATVDQAKMALLLEHGVNRISFGGQSFHDQELHTLERIHTPGDIARSVTLARSSGIRHINLDLMFGIPGQSMDSLRESLLRAIELEVDHLSCYALTYEPDTLMSARVNQGLIAACDEDLEADMYLMVIDLLSAHGFEQYEISNFAKPGCQCQHNLVYWSNCPYLGIGPSASSYVDGARFKNVSHIPTYLDCVRGQRAAWREEERLSGAALAAETAMLQLRLNRGIDVAQFKRQTGSDPLQMFGEPLSHYLHSGHVLMTPTHIRLSRQGRLLADRIIRELLPEPPASGLGVQLTLEGSRFGIGQQ